MRIELNRVACEGHGLCEQTAPEVYEVDQDGYAHLRASEIPYELQAAAEAGARVCPVAALLVHR